MENMPTDFEGSLSGQELGPQTVDEVIRRAKTYVLAQFLNNEINPERLAGRSRSELEELGKLTERVTAGQCVHAAFMESYYYWQNWGEVSGVIDAVMVVEANVRNLESRAWFKRNPRWRNHAGVVIKGKDGLWRFSSTANYVSGEGFGSIIEAESLEQLMDEVEKAEVKYEGSIPIRLFPSAKKIEEFMSEENPMVPIDRGGIPAGQLRGVLDKVNGTPEYESIVPGESIEQIEALTGEQRASYGVFEVPFIRKMTNPLLRSWSIVASQRQKLVFWKSRGFEKK